MSLASSFGTSTVNDYLWSAISAVDTSCGFRHNSACKVIPVLLLGRTALSQEELEQARGCGTNCRCIGSRKGSGESPAIDLPLLIRARTEPPEVNKLLDQWFRSWPITFHQV